MRFLETSLNSSSDQADSICDETFDDNLLKQPFHTCTQHADSGATRTSDDKLPSHTNINMRKHHPEFKDNVLKHLSYTYTHQSMLTCSQRDVRRYTTLPSRTNMTLDHVDFFYGIEKFNSKLQNPSPIIRPCWLFWAMRRSTTVPQHTTDLLHLSFSINHSEVKPIGTLKWCLENFRFEDISADKKNCWKFYL